MHQVEHPDWPFNGHPRPSIRRRLEDTIEALIAQLDELEGEDDLEEDEDFEGSLGWPNAGSHPRPNGTRYACESGDDREHDEAEMEEGDLYEDREPDDEGDPDMEREGDPDQDKEPALGWNAEASQAHLMGGVSAFEDEPSLGSTQGNANVPQGGLHWCSPHGLRGGAGGPLRYDRDGSQEHWGHQAAGQIDAEEEHDGAEPENEHGGDILDEPHDAVDEDAGGTDCAEDFALAPLPTLEDKRLANRFAMRAMALAERRKSVTDPTVLPRRYAMRCFGNCMEPLIKGGRNMVFDTQQPIAPGDVVAVWFKPECVPPGFTRTTLKRLVSQDSSSITVEMLNPPKCWRLDLSTIWAVHRHIHFM